MNDFDRRIIGAATREDLLSIREAVNETARTVAELAGAYRQRCKDDDRRWAEVRADIGELHGRINSLPETIDTKVAAGIRQHAEDCAEETGPAVKAFHDIDAARRVALRTAQPVVSLAVAVVLVPLAVLLGTGHPEAAAITGTVFGAATPFALLLLNRK